jgi:hypothetical protein
MGTCKCLRLLTHLLSILAAVLDDEGIDLLNGVPQLVVRIVWRQLQLGDQSVHLSQWCSDETMQQAIVASIPRLLSLRGNAPPNFNADTAFDGVAISLSSRGQPHLGQQQAYGQAFGSGLPDDLVGHQHDALHGVHHQQDAICQPQTRRHLIVEVDVACIQCAGWGSNPMLVGFHWWRSLQ